MWCVPQIESNMKTLCFLLLASTAFVVAAASNDCYSKARGKLVQFNGKTIDVHLPCKYYALKYQRCGDYAINLSPGNIWVKDAYYLDTLWLGVNNTKTGKGWEGRTTNKLVVKFHNTDGERDLFNKKGGELNTDDLFNTGFVDGGPAAYIEDKDKTFRVTVQPWEPYNKNLKLHPFFKFECFDENAELNGYPAQVCGGESKTELDERARLPEFFVALSQKIFVTYHDVFMSDVVQVDERCIEAADIFQNVCDNSTRVTALKNCMDILNKKRNTECVSTFQCDPMEAFNNCMRWGCTGTGFQKSEKDLCIKVGEGIDLCGNITGPGNTGVTDRLTEAGCFNDYLTIEYKDEE
ncbi:uncharacterized protein LOC143274953 [Babylonia areolata]|uniref:uncharacterized protein LOC143274953 n=1 Tax=Babylonia areolata TaxID=304850 RepID=UPI003FD0008B